MDRVFLDANVLHSAAWRPKSALHRLWRRDGVELLSSQYAVDEARRNLETPAQRGRLTRLLRRGNPSVDRRPGPFRAAFPPGGRRRPYPSAGRISAYHLIGDGSPGGWRTRRTGFPDRLAAASFGGWNVLGKLHEIRGLLVEVLGEPRVLVGCEGFNAVGDAGSGRRR